VNDAYDIRLADNAASRKIIRLWNFETARRSDPLSNFLIYRIATLACMQKKRAAKMKPWIAGLSIAVLDVLARVENAPCPWLTDA
jgi:hypothetical protein